MFIRFFKEISIFLNGAHGHVGYMRRLLQTLL